MDTVLSGIRSTGNLHLGNYFGAVKNFVKMQHENKCYFFVADYHALTTHPKPENLHDNIRKVLSGVPGLRTRSGGVHPLCSERCARDHGALPPA